MSLDVAVLVSVGRHAVSGRARRAAGDARALEMGLSLRERYGARLRVIHAGDPDESALRDYLGMGLSELTVLELAPEIDALPALQSYLSRALPQLLLTGGQAEQGFGSGQLPYAMAQALGMPIVAAVTEIKPEAADVELCQALPHGGRRALRVAPPAVVTVASVAPAPRQSAFARARRGLIVREAVLVELRVHAPCWPKRAARVRPSRPHTLEGVAADRLRALREAPVRKGQRLENPPADTAARAILACLTESGVLKT